MKPEKAICMSDCKSLTVDCKTTYWVILIRKKKKLTSSLDLFCCAVQNPRSCTMHLLPRKNIPATEHSVKGIWKRPRESQYLQHKLSLKPRFHYSAPSQLELVFLIKRINLQLSLGKDSLLIAQSRRGNQRVHSFLI